MLTFVLFVLLLLSYLFIGVITTGLRILDDGFELSVSGGSWDGDSFFPEDIFVY